MISKCSLCAPGTCNHQCGKGWRYATPVLGIGTVAAGIKVGDTVVINGEARTVVPWSESRRQKLLRKIAKARAKTARLEAELREIAG